MLNDDVLFLIFRQVAHESLPQLFALQAVCKNWQELIMESTFIWNHYHKLMKLPPPKTRGRQKTLMGVVRYNLHKYCQDCGASQRLSPWKHDKSFRCVACRYKIARTKFIECNITFQTQELCASHAAHALRLPPKILTDVLKHRSARNPMNARGAPLRLYDVSDLRYLYYAYHGPLKTLLEVATPAEISRGHYEAIGAKRRNYLAAFQEAVRDHGLEDVSRYYLDHHYFTDLSRVVQTLQIYRLRRNLLIRALKVRGLALRGDSRLCDNFIRGDEEKSLREVVDVMAEMDWLFRETIYGQLNRRWNPEGCKVEALVDWFDEHEGAIDINELPSDRFKALVQSFIRNR
jgi:hypothetical protein